MDRSFDNRVGTLLNETLPILRRTVLTVVVIILSFVHFSINAACPEPIVESIETLSSSKVIQAVEEDTLRVLESGPTYKIYDAGVKQYGELTALVQSSNTPISLGEEMRPYMNTQRLWTFFRNNDISLQDDPPEELYVYNWIEKAQGKMIFDVGIPIREQAINTTLPNWLQTKTYEPMKFASLVYVGPFPHQEGSGWQKIQWEARAREKGCVYDERMYRELYHRYDFANNQHITEVQISIK